MNCHLIPIGNELLNGEIIDTNSNFLQKELLAYRIFVKKLSILPDKIETIASEIKQSINKFDYIFITGGLGPTLDDITREAISKALSRKLVKNEEQYAKLAKYTKHGNINHQCLFPTGAKILVNKQGTAAPFYIKEQKSHIFILPGVPFEMKWIFENQITAFVEKELKLYPKPYLEKLTVKTFGIGEPDLDSTLKEKVYSHKNPFKWEIIASKEGVFAKIYPINKAKLDWKHILKQRLEKYLNKYIYAYGKDTMQTVLAKELIKKNITVSTVESCTGGYIAKSLTDYSGSSKYFLGSIVSYSNEIKQNIAQVDKCLINKYGAVSQEVAEAMASNGKRILSSDICLSVTGIAGPLGGTDEKPVGTVCFALIDENNDIISSKRLFRGDREEIRSRSVFYGLNMVWRRALD